MARQYNIPVNQMLSNQCLQLTEISNFCCGAGDGLPNVNLIQTKLQTRHPSRLSHFNTSKTGP